MCRGPGRCLAGGWEGWRLFSGPLPKFAPNIHSGKTSPPRLQGLGPGCGKDRPAPSVSRGLIKRRPFSKKGGLCHEFKESLRFRVTV